MSDSEREVETQTLLAAGQELVEVPIVLPVLPVRDVVLFPGVTVPLAIGREKSLQALEQAGPGGFMIVATQRDPAIEDPGIDDLFPTACVVRVMRVIDARRDGKQAIVVGIVRTRLAELLATEPAFTMRLDPIPDEDPDPERRDELWTRFS